jgi:MarR family transcriptional regulator, 2-MHQ and catechol-resistance regulon repressor
MRNINKLKRPIFPDLDITDTNVRVYVLFLQTATAVQKHTEKAFIRQGITAIQFAVLQLIALKGGAVSHVEISQWMQTKENNTTTLIDRMTRNGLVEREDDLVDRRVSLVKMTGKGSQILKRAQSRALQVVNEIISHIPDIESFEKTVRAVRDGAFRS